MTKHFTKAYWLIIKAIVLILLSSKHHNCIFRV